jgi:hypothetical protein
LLKNRRLTFFFQKKTLFSKTCFNNFRENLSSKKKLNLKKKNQTHKSTFTNKSFFLFWIKKMVIQPKKENLKTLKRRLYLSIINSNSNSNQLLSFLLRFFFFWEVWEKMK